MNAFGQKKNRLRSTNIDSGRKKLIPVKKKIDFGRKKIKK
jgi:hypothetical protein